MPLNIKKLSDNEIRLWVGDYISSTAVSALNTDKGIIVIDTTRSPSLDFFTSYNTKVKDKRGN